MAAKKLRVAKAAGVAVLLAAIGVGSFFAAQALRATGQTGAELSLATATPTPVRTPREPISVGTTPIETVVNEIEIVTGGMEPLCPGGSQVAASHDVARGTVWEIDPAYLPPGATEIVTEPAEDSFPVSLCEGKIVRSRKEFYFNGPAGLTIIKIARRQTSLASGTGPAFPGTVNGKAAVLADLPPQSPEAEDLAAEMGVPGLGTAEVIIQEEFGLTKVIGQEMSLAETIKVAEGLK